MQAEYCLEPFRSILFFFFFLMTTKKHAAVSFRSSPGNILRHIDYVAVCDVEL